VYTICKILGTLQRCVLSLHQIVTTVFTTGILYLFLVEQSYEKILCHFYEINRGNAGLCLLTPHLVFFPREYVGFSHIGQDILLIYLFSSHVEY